MKITRFTIAKAVLATVVLVVGCLLFQYRNRKISDSLSIYYIAMSVALVVVATIEAVYNKKHKRNKCPTCGAEIDTLYYCPMCGAAITKKVSKEDEHLISQAVSDVDKICAYDHYDARLFSLFGAVSDLSAFITISENAKLKGVRLMAARMVSIESFAAAGESELDKTTRCANGKINLGGFFLGLPIEDAYAMLAASYPLLNPTLYLDGYTLSIADNKGNDIAWANVQTGVVHWLTLPPQVVKSIVGFESDSLDGLEHAVEKRFAVSFREDIVKKDDVMQQIGNLDTEGGETLRYFKGAPYGDPSVGLEYAQKDAYAKIVKSPCFAMPGALQLQATSLAV